VTETSTDRQVLLPAWCCSQQIVILHLLNGWVSADSVSALKATSLCVNERNAPPFSRHTAAHRRAESALLRWYQTNRTAEV